VPGWAKEMQSRPLINARSETILEKASFKNAIRRRRCLIPTDGFFEWEGDIPGKKKPWHIHRPDHQLFAFAGVWEHWMAPDGSELETAAIITSEPNLEISRIHDRSPVVIAPEDFLRWLDPANDDHFADLMRPPDDGYFMLEPKVIVRNAPPKKVAPPPPPKSQMDLF
jgi:putative SOS response-associated peptidase YedK